MKHRINIHTTIMALLILFVGMTGCTPNNNLNGLVPGAGKILYQGNTVDGAVISLIPIDMSGTIRPATGITDSQGRFILTTLQPQDGVFPGEFKVVISKTLPGKLISEKIIGGIPMSIYAPDKHLLPEKYSDSAATPLTVTVSKKGNKEMVFELND